MNVLVTGGAGFIGSSLVARLLNVDDVNVTVIDNLSTGFLSNLDSDERVKFIHCDVNDSEDLAAVFLVGRFEYVFHFAAVVGVARTLSNPISVLSDLDGIRNILKLSKNTGVRKVFYASSSEVYGEPVSLPQHESVTPLNSRLPYAVAKNVGEVYCRAFYQEYRLPYQILRFFNTYGPKQSDDFVVSRFIRLALANSDIHIYGDGTQTRTFCFIDDNIECVVRMLTEGFHSHPVVNIGSDVCVSINELANLVIRLTDSKSRILYLPPLPEGDMSRRQPDNSIMKSILGRPLISLEDGLKIVLRNWSG
jgi:UDP-glucose 4-epimerase